MTARTILGPLLTTLAFFMLSVIFNGLTESTVIATFLFLFASLGLSLASLLPSEFCQENNQICRVQ